MTTVKKNKLFHTFFVFYKDYHGAMPATSQNKVMRLMSLLAYFL